MFRYPARLHLAALRRLIGLCAMLWTALFWHAAAGAASPEKDPARIFLENIYASYSDGSGGVAYQGREQDYFTPELAALIVKDRKEAGNDGLSIDFDVFIGAQDWDNLTAKIQLGLNGEKTRPASATVTSFGKTRLIGYTLVETPSGWRIADMRWEGERVSLLDLLKAPMDANDASQQGPKEFLEDIYRHYADGKGGDFDYDREGNRPLYFTREVISLMEADDRAHVGEPGRLEFDLFAGGQEFGDIKATVSIGSANKNTAIAVVNLDDSIAGPSTITYNLAYTRQGWRISDIRWSRMTMTMIEMLKEENEGGRDEPHK